VVERLRRRHRTLYAVWWVWLAAGAAGVGVVSHEGHHRDLPGPLDGRPKGTLMFGAHAGPAARLNLGAF